MGITSLSQANAEAATGLVLVAASSFSGVSSVSIDSCFTSVHDNYRVLFTNTSISSSGSTDIRVRVRASSTDLSSAAYQYGRGYTGSGTSGTVDLAATALLVSNVSSPQYIQTAMEFYAPALTAITAWTSYAMTNENLAGAYTQMVSGIVNNTTAYDGFTAFPSNGTFSGVLSVYGYRKAL